MTRGPCSISGASRRGALYFVDRLLNRIGAPEDVRQVARRQSRLLPAAPPGAARPVIAADLYGGRLTA